MKETKRRFETYSFYDHTGIARHLEKMAQKGWLVERIANFVWVYRRVEPQKLHFSVSYYPKASGFDPEPAEEQKAFYDFCEHTGWILAADSAQIQVFYNEQENPVPIETDPGTEIEVIHRAARKTFLPADIALMVIGILGLAMFVSRLLGDPIGLLASTSGLFTGFAWIMLLLAGITELGGYYLWRYRAQRAAEHGEFLGTRGYAGLPKLILYVVLIGFACWLISLFFMASNLVRAAGLLMILYMGVLFFLVNAVKQFLKRKKAPAAANRIVTLASSFVLALVLMGGITFGLLKGAQNGVFERDRQTYRYEGHDFELYLDELPLTVEDLMDIEYTGEYIRERRSDESLLLAQFVMRQHARLDAGHRSDMPELEYTITRVKLPALYHFCKNTLIGSGNDESAGGESVSDGRYDPVDAVPWGAAEAYRYFEDSNYRNRYLLCYGDYMVEITFDWEPAPEQMKLVGEKLAFV